MNYVASFLICAIEIFLLWVYFRKQNLFDVLNTNGEERLVSKVNHLQLFGSLAAIAAMMIISTIITLGNVANYLNYLKLILLFGIVSAAAVIDFKKTIIPNLLILLGLGARVAIYLAELSLFKDTFVPQLKSDLLGFTFGFGFLLIVSIISKGSLGFGDVKLFGIIGLMSGAICTYYVLIFCLLVSAIVSAILLVLRRKERKDSIPFAPCIMIGYFVALVLGCY